MVRAAHFVRKFTQAIHSELTAVNRERLTAAKKSVILREWRRETGTSE